MNSIYGALVGDAAGATLEFYRQGPLTKEVVQRAMRMPGGGAHRVGPGQITDDGELTLTLLRSLLKSASLSKNEQQIEMMRGYADWYDSIPFDIGNTCSLAFDYLASLDHYLPSISIQTIENEIASTNSFSQANGALMRASAIAAWGRLYHVPIEDVMECAKQDARLSHPNIICQEANAIYVFALYYLLQGDSPQDVLKRTTDYVDRNVTSECIKHWYYQESLEIDTIDCTKQAGHLRWAFIIAIYFLRHPEFSFEDAMEQVLIKGGDTDTNAAIVGGLVACYQPIPSWMLDPVLQYNATESNGRMGRIRPETYCPFFTLQKILLNSIV